MPLHPQRERFQTAHDQEAFERPRDRADGILQKRNLIGELLVLANNDNTADQV